MDFISKDIKYNMTFEEVEEFISENNIKKFNKDNILDEIKVKNIKNIEEGEGVIVKFNRVNRESIEYEIRIGDMGKVFKKSRWMDDIK